MIDDIKAFLESLPAGTKEAAAWDTWVKAAREAFRDAWLARAAKPDEEFRVLPEDKP